MRTPTVNLFSCQEKSICDSYFLPCGQLSTKNPGREELALIYPRKGGNAYFSSASLGNWNLGILEGWTNGFWKNRQKEQALTMPSNFSKL
jgi:hypothetical protein